MHLFDEKAGIAIFRKKNNENNFVECKWNTCGGSKEFF